MTMLPSGKGKGAIDNGSLQPKVQQKQDKIITSFFYKKDGHVKKDCPKYETWLVKKGKLLNFVCYEVTLTLIPNHTW